MFGRGTWAILGLGKESLEAFRTYLEDKPAMISASQMAASAITRYSSVDTVGLNPFGGPRLDEEHPLNAELEPELAGYASSDVEERSTLTLSEEILECQGFGASEAAFRLHPTIPWYGMWAVFNEWKDVSDLASIKEQKSYRLMERPYRFLQATDKKSIDGDTLGINAATRKQVPVLLDFSDGRLYVENSNPKLIYMITVRLRQLGVEVVPVAWTYPRPNWPAEILNRLYENTQYARDFQKRAEEATRFKASEIEKLEDRELESIVANYFSMTQLPSDLWVGISGPAQVQLHPASPPIAVKAPTTATTLLQMTDDAKVISGSLTFQEVVSAVSKKGMEYTFRKDLLGLQVNDRMNLTDIGAAMMRGFEVPAFRKDILREIRQTRVVPPIEQFWGNWLHEMSNAVRVIEGSFRELLELDGKEEAGIVPMKLAPADTDKELVATA